MDFATIPLPQQRGGVTITKHTQVYPEPDGYTTGVVHAEKSGRTTVQCSVCLRCATGARPADPIMHARFNFEPDDGVPGHTTHRRCPQCRTQKLHP